MGALRELLDCHKLVLLDSAMGTELARRGVDISGPLWSARANFLKPDVVRHIHLDNIDCGADIITTNTFRTQRRTFDKAKYEHEGRTYKETACEATKIAVELAQDAVIIAGTEVLVAGCIAPLEDCYRPDLVPQDMDELCAEHYEHIRNLVEAGADILLAETMISMREISAVLNQMHKCGIDYAISLLCRNDSELFSGEKLTEVMSVVDKYSPVAVMLNCIHPAMAEQVINKLKTLTDKPLGIYANTGNPNTKPGDKFQSVVSPAEYYHFAKRWKELGVRIIGGCCGTTPEYLMKLNALKK